MSALTLDDLLKISSEFEQIRTSRRLTYILAGKEVYSFLLEKFRPIELKSGFEVFGFHHGDVEIVKFGLTGDWDLLLLDQNKEILETVRIELTDKKDTTK